MKLTPFKIDGAWIIELNKFEDGRGFFYESFRKEIAKDDNNTKLLMSRQDLMKLLKDADAAIDAESVVVSE
jgi:dTDP-4-dehydrorhamnose 3,5-epimerase-like enzyme